MSPQEVYPSINRVYLEVKSHFNQQIQANSTSVNHRHSTINADDILCSPFRDGLMVLWTCG
jgi:hypothetical protein